MGRPLFYRQQSVSALVVARPRHAKRSYIGDVGLMPAFDAVRNGKLCANDYPFADSDWTTALIKDRSLSTTEKMVALSIRSFAATDDDEVYPGYNSLMQIASVNSHRTIAKVVRRLVEIGYIRNRHKPGQCRVFSFTIPDDRRDYQADIAATFIRGDAQ